MIIMHDVYGTTLMIMAPWCLRVCRGPTNLPKGGQGDELMGLKLDGDGYCKLYTVMMMRTLVLG